MEFPCFIEGDMGIFEEGVCCYMWYSVPVFSAGLVRMVAGMCVPPIPLCLQDRLICCGVTENTQHLKYVPFVVWKKSCDPVFSY